MIELILCFLKKREHLSVKSNDFGYYESTDVLMLKLFEAFTPVLRD